MYRSSPFRSTLNTSYITGMCKVCAEAVHSVALCPEKHAHTPKRGNGKEDRNRARGVFQGRRTSRSAGIYIYTVYIDIRFNSVCRNSFNYQLVPEWIACPNLRLFSSNLYPLACSSSMAVKTQLELKRTLPFKTPDFFGLHYQESFGWIKTTQDSSPYFDHLPTPPKNLQKPQ